MTCLFIAPFEGTAVVLDFQTYGKGLVSNDFAQLINWSYDTRSYEEVEEFSRGNQTSCLIQIKYSVMFQITT